MFHHQLKGAGREGGYRHCERAVPCRLRLHPASGNHTNKTATFTHASAELNASNMISAPHGIVRVNMNSCRHAPVVHSGLQHAQLLTVAQLAVGAVLLHIHWVDLQPVTRSMPLNQYALLAAAHPLATNRQRTSTRRGACEGQTLRLPPAPRTRRCCMEQQSYTGNDPEQRGGNGTGRGTHLKSCEVPMAKTMLGWLLE